MFSQERPALGEATHLLAMAEPLLRCAWCGPVSLRPHAERCPEAECDISKIGCERCEIDKYVECCCGLRFSYACLNSIGAIVKDSIARRTASGRRQLLDPHGVWATLVDKPWLRGEAGGVFKPQGKHLPASLRCCPQCEDHDLPEPEPRLPLEFVNNKKPDLEPPITRPVIFSPLLPTGRRGEEIIFAPEEIAAHPIVHTDECVAAFKGGRGSREEYGGALFLQHSNSARTRTRPARSSATLAPLLVLHPTPSDCSLA